MKKQATSLAFPVYNLVVGDKYAFQSEKYSTMVNVHLLKKYATLYHRLFLEVFLVRFMNH